MEVKNFIILVLLFSFILFASVLSGCVEQNEIKQPISTPERNVTTSEKNATIEREVTNRTKTESPTLNLIEIIKTYDNQIKEAEKTLFDMGFDLESPEINSWKNRSAELLIKAEKEKNSILREKMLKEAATLKYHELQNLRNLVSIVELEKAYWESAVSGGDISEFYNTDGDLFYGSGDEIRNVSVTQMVEKMSAVKGMTFQSLEIYHFGTGSNLVFIREGGRTIGAGQVAAKIGVPENGVLIEPADPKNVPALRAISIQTTEGGTAVSSKERTRNPQTGKEIHVINPGDNGLYTIQHVNFSTIIVPEEGNSCFKIDNYPVVCSSPIVATFILEPSSKLSFESVSPDEMYIMPGNYTVTTLVMKADLKQLAEQLVNINARIGGGEVSVDTPIRAPDVFQGAVTKTVNVDFTTPYETNPGSLLDVVSKSSQEMQIFKNVSAPAGAQSITTNNFSIKLYVISNSHGDVLIVPQIQGILKESSDYTDRMFLEVFSGRSAKIGDEVRVISFKILDLDGTVDYRASVVSKAQNIRIAMFLSDSGER